MPPLYIVGSPIGNLNDISQRAIDTLSQSDIILCESKSRANLLLDRYNIGGKTLITFREENKKRITPHIIDELMQYKKVSLISDAGMPSISDPGMYLINEVFRHSLEIRCIPGPTAFASAISMSGFDCRESVFIGFMPRNSSEIREMIDFYRARETIIVFYESPNRIIETLKVISEEDPASQILIAREITKIYEEYIRGSPEGLIQQLSNRDIKGEITVVMKPTKLEESQNYDTRLVQILREEGLGTKDIASIISKYYGIPSRSIYNEIIKDKDT